MRIWINKEGRAKLMEVFGRSQPIISLALNFKWMWKLHSEIRSYAVNHLNGKFIDINENE